MRYTYEVDRTSNGKVKVQEDSTRQLRDLHHTVRLHNAKRPVARGAAACDWIDATKEHLP